MAKQDLLSPEQLRQLLRYEPDTGKLFWLPRDASWFPSGAGRQNNSCSIWNSRYAGSLVSNVTVHGYIRFACLGRMILAHRAAWAITYDRWPVYIDHINGVGTDNRISNLREVATLAENNRNIKMRSDNRSGATGIHKTPSGWLALLNVEGRQKNLGRFATMDAAIAARKAAQVEAGYHPTHGEAKTIR